MASVKNALCPVCPGTGYAPVEKNGEPMRSRLYEMCKTVVMQGEDFRQRFKPDEHRL